jgi:hypothetical protein
VGLGGTILHFDGIIWRELDSGVRTSLNGVWSRPGGETVVVGDGGLVLHSGTGFAGEKAWTPPPEVVTIFSLMAIAGNPQGEVFAVGKNGVVLRYAGQSWESMPTGFFDQLHAIHVGSCGDIYTAGFDGLILRYGN